MDINDVIEKVNIKEYISQYTNLEEKNGEYWGVSPLSDKDVNPSFSVREDTGVFKDFSSGKGGNVLTFIMEYNKVGFKEAIKILCSYIGEDYSNIREIPASIRELKKFQVRTKVKKEVQRNALNDDFLNKFKYGDIQLWQNQGIEQEIMNKYRIGYDVQRECITIPIYDDNNNLINIQARNIGSYHEKIGSPKYIYYHKIITIDFFWALNFKRDLIISKGECLIFEGCKSVLLAEQFGYDNSIAMLTSHLNDAQLNILIKLGVDITLCLDKDVNIKEDKNILLLKRFCNVFYVKDTKKMLDEKDSPTDKGKEVFDMLYQERKRL